MKTIGVIGGIGPQATMDFEARVHRVSQRLIPQKENSGYPPMIVYYFRHAPVIQDDRGRPKIPHQPDLRLLEVAKHLGALADFLVITANSPHEFHAQIEEAAGCMVYSMIDLALAAVQEKKWQKIGVLGLGPPVVYLDPLARMGIACDTVSGVLRAALDSGIFALMAGQEDEQSTQAALDAVEFLRGKNVDGILLGCSELPLLLGDHARAPDLLDPGALLAEAAVRYAMT